MADLALMVSQDLRVTLACQGQLKKGFTRQMTILYFI